jgi:hypothetical protein
MPARIKGTAFRFTAEMMSNRCGKLMVNEGTDTYDPMCDLPAGHERHGEPVCKSTGAVTQNKLSQADLKKIWENWTPPNTQQVVLIEGEDFELYTTRLNIRSCKVGEVGEILEKIRGQARAQVVAEGQVIQIVWSVGTDSIEDLWELRSRIEELEDDIDGYLDFDEHKLGKPTKVTVPLEDLFA